MRRHKVILPNGLTMAQIAPSKSTRAELALRMIFVRHGLRHRTQVRWGPDDRWCCDLKVLGVLVDVHGFHFHSGKSKMFNMSSFWKDKIKRNRARDREKRRHAERHGLLYLVVWDFQVLSKDPRDRLTGRQILDWIRYERRRRLP